MAGLIVTTKPQKLRFSKMDPALCSAPGLFISLPKEKNARKKRKLDITYDYGDCTLKFMCFEPLAVDDLRFIQAIVAHAGPEGKMLREGSACQLQAGLWGKLRLADTSKNADVLFIRVTEHRILASLGLSGGKNNYDALRKSLCRCSNLSINTRRGAQVLGGCQFLAYADDEDTGELLIALNPRVTAVVIGGGRHVHINLEEVRQLKTDPARLIHQRLCSFVNPGKTKVVGINTLTSYAWLELAEGGAKRWRASRVRKAMHELAELGWLVETLGGDSFRIERPILRKELPC